MDELDERYNDLFWHALNYRTAGMQEAQVMWLELEACVERKIAAERKRCHEIVQLHQIRNGHHDHEGDRIGHFSTRIFDLILTGAPSGMWELTSPAK